MAVFRIERTKDYTVMSNHHLRNHELSLKAKGLLSMMLSLPDDWNYTTRGLAKICKEGVDAIGSALRELETAGYIVRNQLRDQQGRISDTEYVIYEKPQPRQPETPRPDTAVPDTASPDTENPYLDKPDTEKPAELNIEKPNTQKQNTHGASTDSIPFRETAAAQLPERKGRDAMSVSEIENYRELILENIEYDYLCREFSTYDTIEDADGKERRVLNAKETTLAAQKQQAIRDAFKDWIWKDPDRRQALVRQYNEEMNSTRPREYDGGHITFGGMNPAITLREHQKNAIAHVLYGGNTLLAHEVGAGKTFEMVAAAMESKRLGLCQKSLFVVPNHLTEQWASEFLRLYPSANILVTTKKDFETHNRKKFCARIATGDYDAIIMGHSQFEKIPISRERQERLLQEQIDEITEGIAEVKYSGGERFTVKQLERTKKSLEARLEKLQAESRKDDVVTFEQLGVDRLFVDEAHNYDSTVYPPLENVPRRFSISHRNRWMVESADVVVAYVLHDWGGAATTLRCAKQKKKQIISYRDEMGS
ncbi:hypothetical protein B5F94_12975 [Flavonifractor sp. An4]|nr:hypothetical protein B5F94_12975 [Flavonifractor sp. An4]